MFYAIEIHYNDGDKQTYAFNTYVDADKKARQVAELAPMSSGFGVDYVRLYQVRDDFERVQIKDISAKEV